LHAKIEEALRILVEVGMPRGQQNERSALCLLAITDLTPEKSWADAGAPLIGITPIMEFAAAHYMDKPYAPNTRETIRRQTMHQFVRAGIALCNPDDPRAATHLARVSWTADDDDRCTDEIPGRRSGPIDEPQPQSRSPWRRRRRRLMSCWKHSLWSKRLSPASLDDQDHRGVGFSSDIPDL